MKRRGRVRAIFNLARRSVWDAFFQVRHKFQNRASGMGKVSILKADCRQRGRSLRNKAIVAGGHPGQDSLLVCRMDKQDESGSLFQGERIPGIAKQGAQFRARAVALHFFLAAALQVELPVFIKAHEFTGLDERQISFLFEMFKKTCALGDIRGCHFALIGNRFEIVELGEQAKTLCFKCAKRCASGAIFQSAEPDQMLGAFQGPLPKDGLPYAFITILGQEGGMKLRLTMPKGGKFVLQHVAVKFLPTDARFRPFRDVAPGTGQIFPKVHVAHLHT